MSSLRLLFLVGSVKNDFYLKISRNHAHKTLTDCLYLSNYNVKIAYISIDGLWRFPQLLNQKEIDEAKPLSLPEALQYITTLKIDVMVPYMFCIPGVTHYRAIFDLLNIPYLGQTPDLMAIIANKAKAKAIVASSGVNVPVGEVLRKGDIPTLRPPTIVKPATEDNSFGISFVRKIEDYVEALDLAFKYADEVIVESFIEAGREVRCGVIVRNDELICLPLEEYPLRPDNPVRTTLDKFPENNQPKKCWIVDRSDPITEKVQQEALKCHKALGCRHYSLFDFRVDPQGRPWFIEASLYCIYNENSVICVMAKADGITVEQVFTWAIEETLKGNRKSQTC
eukprot:TRINITY_DN2366_c0_g1_i1.p1 TRINITY_DN2366_c0_g1~~TRINITY_DN2366_c0_g1_i1.p1  ORF type:complete len:339 (+),score=12.45 TRINITY_DN2366_c0_g1_i1:82-1098(+)